MWQVVDSDGKIAYLSPMRRQASGYCRMRNIVSLQGGFRVSSEIYSCVELGRSLFENEQGFSRGLNPKPAQGTDEAR